MPKKTYVHVNQHVIKRNRTHGESEPALTVKTYNTNDYAHEAVVVDDDGNELGRFVYSPDKPLSCGAHVWFETKNQVIAVVHEQGKKL